MNQEDKFREAVERAQRAHYNVGSLKESLRKAEQDVDKAELELTRTIRAVFGSKPILYEGSRYVTGNGPYTQVEICNLIVVGPPK